MLVAATNRRLLFMSRSFRLRLAYRATRATLVTMHGLHLPRSAWCDVQMDALSFKKMDFPEFCAAAISVHQLEGTDRWEQYARAAYDIFEKEGNRAISVDDLARVRHFHRYRHYHRQ